MNERIKELFKKAGGKTSTRNLASNPVQVVETHELWDDHIEKFAELIVKECCDVLQNEDIRYGGYGYNQGFLHKKIKEHFGVKE
jgi:hypothetical protein